MNREEYLKRLSFLLKDLPEEEIEDAIAYYEDYFEEAGEEKEEIGGSLWETSFI